MRGGALSVGLGGAVLVVGCLLPASAAPDAAHRSRIVVTSQHSVSFMYNQGVAKTKGGWILTGTDSPIPATDIIVRTDGHLHVITRQPAAIPPEWRQRGYDHIGDIDVVHGVIYAPFEQPQYAKGHQVTALYDATTLTFVRAFVLPQHQNSFVTVDPKTMIAYTQDEFGGSKLLRYDVRHHWKKLRPLQMSRILHHTQGADIVHGTIFISTSDPHNDIWKVNLRTGHVTHLGTHAHPGGEGEGIDATRLRRGPQRGVLHALVTDPAMHPVWFENFAWRKH
jgi:hypothetical protein